jgi:N-methylhydantoinase A
MTQLDMKYAGQTSETTVNMPHDRFSAASLVEMGELFMVEHEKTYGYRVDEAFQLVSIRVIARGISPKSRVPETMKLGTDSVPVRGGERDVYFGGRRGWVSTPVIGRAALSKGGQDGPAIVEEYDSTTVVPPGWRASLDPLKNIVLSTAR